MYALRAAITALSTSLACAYAIFERIFSVAGLIVLNVFEPLAATNFPLINRPYCALISTIDVDSGAGEYSNVISNPMSHS